MFRDAINVLFQLKKSLSWGGRKVCEYQRIYLDAVNRRISNGQKKKDKRTNNDLQNNIKKNTECATRTPLKTVSDRMCSKKISSSHSSNVTVVLFVLNRL